MGSAAAAFPQRGEPPQQDESLPSDARVAASPYFSLTTLFKSSLMVFSAWVRSRTASRSRRRYFDDGRIAEAAHILPPPIVRRRPGRRAAGGRTQRRDNRAPKSLA